jgi:hypothetical protein
MVFMLKSNIKSFLEPHSTTSQQSIQEIEFHLPILFN